MELTEEEKNPLKKPNKPKRNTTSNTSGGKTKGRSERISELAMMRNNKDNLTASSQSQSNDASWPLTSSSRSATTETSSNAVEDRHKLVMAKLSNKPKQKSSRFNIFKKDKK
jgi:hypothetical protein